MSKYEELTRQLNTLPKGYISKKTIKGHEYHYLQWLDNGKIQSQYVREENLLDIYGKLDERKKLENELVKLADAGRDAPVLSKRAMELTGSLMMGDLEVARFNKGQLSWIDEERAPLYVVRTHNISGFLASRAIDSSRTNARVLKKVLNIHGESDDIVALHSHGATITDNYWFRARGSKLRYRDISFESDLYSDVTLNGSTYIYNKKAKLSPELTLTGSYEKCWKLIDGEWWMYKRGNAYEIFSELLSAQLAELMGIPTAQYELAKGEPGVIKTRNFAGDYNFEPMISIAGDDDSYDNVLDKLNAIDTELAKDYIRIILFDAIVNNVDRHNENLGIMRDRNNGTIVGLSPNFDNNLALIARTRTLNMNPARDGMIKFYKDFIKRNPVAAEYEGSVAIAPLTKEAIEICVRRAADVCKQELGDSCRDVDCDQIIKYVFDRYNYLSH